MLLPLVFPNNVICDGVKPTLSVLSTIAVACALVIVVVFPAKAVEEVIPNPGKVTLSVFAAMASACVTVILIATQAVPV